MQQKEAGQGRKGSVRKRYRLPLRLRWYLDLKIVTIPVPIAELHYDDGVTYLRPALKNVGQEILPTPNGPAYSSYP